LTHGNADKHYEKKAVNAIASSSILFAAFRLSYVIPSNNITKVRATMRNGTNSSGAVGAPNKMPPAQIGAQYQSGAKHSDLAGAKNASRQNPTCDGGCDCNKRSITKQKELKSISDDDLLCRLKQLTKQSRRVESEMVAHVGEGDERKLYAREDPLSMFAYCTDVLHLSESETHLRITAAQASRRHPVLLVMLADGRFHLSDIAELAPHVTPNNCNSLLSRTARMSKRESEELLAELSLKPDVPAVIRKLPTRRAEASPVRAAELRPDTVNFEMPTAPVQPVQNSRITRPAVVALLAPAGYKVQFTASASFSNKVERLSGLMRSSIADGRLAALIENAVTEKPKTRIQTFCRDQGATKERRRV
jgi:hypothetical protein